MSQRPHTQASLFTPAGQIGVFGAVSASLTSLISGYLSGQAPQALLLSGPFGVGKRTLAQLLSLCLFCKEGDAAPCGQCKACKRLVSESHPDHLVLRLLPNAKSIKIDQVRDILSQLSQYPLEGGRRVVVLEDFDLFTVPAQNALLKAIEEPDQATSFILTATNEKAVLSTILSRCRLQRLPAWPDEALASFLTSRGLCEKTVQDLVPLSGGSPGTAMRLAEDEDFWSLKTRADEAFLGLRGPLGLPEASDKLKDFRQEASQLMDYLETKAIVSFNPETLNQSDPDTRRTASLRHRALLESLFLARRQLASNVTWQGIADQLLLNILEENQPCPW
ncbi:MAG: DNA polymerase III subunit delta' [Clostridiales bacterium]|nr:DNA polymerase III subunit delta' [Clostridiales bacterium]